MDLTDAAAASAAAADGASSVGGASAAPAAAAAAAARDGAPDGDDGAPRVPRACAVWNARDGQFVRWLPVRGTPRAAAVSHTGSGLLVHTDAEGGGAPQLELFSLNGRPLTRVALGAPLGQLVCTRDGEMVVASEGAAVTVRRMHDLQEMHAYSEPPVAVSALSLCAQNHHAFVATEDGGLCVLANPIVNIQVLEAIAGELLNL